MNSEGRITSLLSWLESRVPVPGTIEALRTKVVPRHRHDFWYIFGGLTLFFLIVQIVTGILLALYYVPSPDHAYESVRAIVMRVPHGWLIRSIHSWSANLMVGCLFVHMFSVFVLKSYRKPRELMWVSGVLLLFVVLGFGFTGYLLPWDTTAYFATMIGTEVPKSLPVVGDLGVGLLKGAEDIGPETLSRMYTIHTVILPLTALVIVGFHLLLNQILGSSTPVGAQNRGSAIPFFPNYMVRDLIVWAIGFGALLVLAAGLPWGLGDKADPLASPPAGIHPEWYFLPLYQTLRMFPSNVLGLNGELLVNLAVGAVATFWLVIPFIDRRASREQRSRLFTIIGVCLAVYLGGTILIAYLTT